MISMIAAVGRNSELGRDNDLIWHLSSDMKFFRSTTKGHTIIMGRKTFESLGGLLPGRHHVVLTSNEGFSYEGVEVLHTPQAVLDKYADSPEECFVIGGGEVYKIFLPFARRLYLTHIGDECPSAEVFFPTFEPEDFVVTELERFCENSTSAVIKRYERR